MKPIIVGQAPSRSSDPSEPLSGRSGERLAFLCNCTHGEFLAAFERRNLLDAFPGKDGKGDGFVSPGEARLLAIPLISQFIDRRIILLGNMVATAFGVEYPHYAFFRHLGASYTVTPHPSGINRHWNEPGSVQTAAVFWRSVYLKAKV